MLIRGSPQLQLTQVVALVHVFLATFLLPLAVSDDHSVALADHQGSVRRTPPLLFRVIEGNGHGGSPTGADPVYRRRSRHRAANNDENYILRRAPVTSRRSTRYRRTNVNENHNVNEKTNANVNSYDVTRGNLHEDEVPRDDTQSDLLTDEVPDDASQEIDSISEEVGDDPAVVRLETKLYASITFRDNIIVVFGQILNSPDIELTIDQFTSLNLITQALIHKRVYMFDLLPIMKMLQSADREDQLTVVMIALTNNVPAYMESACKFLLQEIEQRYLDVEKLTSLIDQQANFLAGIDPEVIDACTVEDAAEELLSLDEPSKLTAKTLGPVFVNIFNKMKNHRMKLSRKLFAAILMNLPIGNVNPPLEEYIRYIWDSMQGSVLSNWNDVVSAVGYGNPYEIVNAVIKKLLRNRATPIDLQQALKYILMHLKEVPKTFSDKYHSDMQILFNGNENVELLLSLIPDDLAIPKLNELKKRLIVHIKEIDIDEILQGMNIYTYQKPIDLLIATLVRIQSRTQNEDVKDILLKLVSILISKEELDTFTVKGSADIDLVILLDFLNILDSKPDISALGKKIKNYLENDLDLLGNLQNLISVDSKPKCNRPIQYLLNIFTEILKPDISKQLGVPSDLLTMIRELIYLMQHAIESSVKCEPKDIIEAEHPEISDDLIDVPFQTKPQSPVNPTIPTLIPQSTKLTGKPSIQPLKPIDYDDVHNKPLDPNSQIPEMAEIIHPAHVDHNVEDPAHPTRPSEDARFPDIWVVRPVQVEFPDSKPKLTLFPEPTVKPIPTVIPSSIPQIIQTLKPSVIPSVIPTMKPQIILSVEPSVIPTVEPIVEPSLVIPVQPPKKSPVTTMPGLRPTKKPPARYTANNPSPAAEIEPVLPPNLSLDRPIYIVFPKGEEPPYTLPTKPNSTSHGEISVELPPIKELLEGFDPSTPFTPDELPAMPEILEPFGQTLGPNYIEEILGKRVDKIEYPTLISLMNDVLDRALDNPKVRANPELVLSIQRYLKAIDYISTVALFPVVIDSRRISSDALHVTFNPDNPNENRVDSEAPEITPPGFITLPIYHPKYWVQQVDPVNPYGTLLPNADGGRHNPIQELINEGSLQEILGPHFDPLLYPNRGTLLTTVLQKLVTSEHVTSQPWLLEKLNAYLKSIRVMAMYSQIPNDYHTHILALQQNNKVNWQADTASLIMALPPARTYHQSNKIELIKAFLETPNLLELLQIDNPPYTTTRGALLRMIFNAAIRGRKMDLDVKLLSALKYYERKILTKGHGALPIGWVSVQMFIIREEVPLGETIKAVLDHDSLPRPLKTSYNDLMTYLSENPQFLYGNEDFAYEKYPTKGTFLKGLFTYLLSKPDISPQAKSHLKHLLPYIDLTGHGADPMNHVTIDDIPKKDGYSVLLSGQLNSLAM